MKTISSLTRSPEHGPGSRLAGRIGTQFAAVLFAIFATPSTLPTRKPHAHAAPAPDGEGTRP